MSRATIKTIARIVFLLFFVSNIAAHWEINIGSTLHADSRIFIAGNIGPNRSDNSKGEWPLAKGDSVKFKSNVRVAANTSIPVVAESADNAFKKVLKNAGATAPQRDAPDARVVSTVNDRTGMVPDRISDVGGYPVYTSSCVVPTDTDYDGMPDYFEDANGLNKQVRDGNSTELSLKFTGREGYTNMEVYLNNLMDKTLNLETYSSNLTDGIYVVSICSENNITNQKINIIQQ